MKPATAKANAHRLAHAMKAEIQEALHAKGLDAIVVVKKLLELLEAKKPMWNPKTKRWDFFADSAVQLEALKAVLRLSNAYPAPKPYVEPAAAHLVIV